MTAWIWFSRQIGARLKACVASWKNGRLLKSPFENKSQKIACLLQRTSVARRSVVARIKLFLNTVLDVASLG